MSHFQLPEGAFRRIVLKPNWVKHEEDAAFPIEALVTSSKLIETVVDACLDKYSKAEEITIGDVPLQSCDWDTLKEQSGINKLIDKYSRYQRPRIRFLDLRRERYRTVNRFHLRCPPGDYGDPKGYREVVLNNESFLDPISDDRKQFRVSDYDPGEITSSHSRGLHRYLIAASVLDADLFINLPKLKTHQKAGVTGALKNLVGINGQKAYLVHFRRGMPRFGGDEFPSNVARSVVLQTRVRDMVQKRSRLLFQTLRVGWQGLRFVSGVETRGTRENLGKRFYIAGGSWFGNDTIWRMVYDLNRVLRYSPREGGSLAKTPQREYIAIMDAIIAGEGNGPLQPLPVQLNRLLVSNDPFLMDCTAARLMGFDAARIPTLANRQLFGDDSWGNFDAGRVEVDYSGEKVTGLQNLPILHQFVPPPGWQGHIELANGRKDELEATRLS